MFSAIRSLGSGLTAFTFNVNIQGIAAEEEAAINELKRRLPLTQEEIRDLGFENSIVVPLGGASVRFDQKGGIVVYGSSDAFGTCDKQIAADLIRKAFPKKTVYIQ